MKIEKIEINNFKGITNKVIIPGRINVLVGKNGAGKSSTIGAVKYFLTGDKTGKEELMKNGTDEMSVNCHLPDGMEMERGIKKTASSKSSFCRVLSKKFDEANYLTKKNKTCTTDSFNEFMKDITGISVDTCKILSASDILDRFEPSQLGSLLLSYIPEELDFDTISRVSGLTPEMIEELELYLPPMPMKFGIETINNAAKAISEETSILNKSKSEAKAKSVYKGPEITQSAAELEKQLEDILRQEGSVKNKIAVKKAYEQALKIKEQQENIIRTLYPKAKANTSVRPNPAEKEDTEKKLAAARNELLKIAKMLQTIHNNMNMFQNTLDNLGKSVCPISEKLICTTDKTSLKSELEALIQSNKEGELYQKELEDKTNNLISSLEQKLSEYKENESLYKEKLLLLKQLRMAQETLKSLTIPEKPEEDIVDTTQLKAELNRNKKFLADKQLASENAALYVEIEKKHKIYKELAKALKPKGIIFDYIMEHYTVLFHDDIKKRSELYDKDFDIRFVSDNGMQVWCKVDATREYVPYNSLSGGEKTIVTFFVLDMLARLSGFKILLLDELESMDATAFDKLVNLLNIDEIRNEYDHIFIAGVDHEDTMNTLKKLKNANIITA